VAQVHELERRAVREVGDVRDVVVAHVQNQQFVGLEPLSRDTHFLEHVNC
jgi:hypothetical protein